MSAQVEVWRVNTVEGVFETDLETLKQWIIEGSVQPTDKVSKGSLSWIEAGRAPMLRSAFAGESPAVSVPSMTNSDPDAPSLSTSFVPQNESTEPPATVSHSIASASSAATCHNHAQVASKYVCRDCDSAFCDDCPKYVGPSKIPLCPLCGDLCTSVES